jgi:hypothetical protein
MVVLSCLTYRELNQWVVKLSSVSRYLIIIHTVRSSSHSDALELMNVMS